MCCRLLITVIILEHLCSYALAGFAEVPSNETIDFGNGEKVVCRCRHTFLEAVIGWRVNESSVGLFPDITTGSIRENGTLVHTLTIPARSEYSGTKVVCVAFFTNGSSEWTRPATLKVRADTAPVTEVVSTPSPPVTEFVSTPSPLNVTVEQGVATFHCQHRSSENIIWRIINEASSNSPNASIEGVRNSDGGYRSSLSITTLLDFNETTVQCVATFFKGSILFHESSPAVTLLIQDIPGNVSNFGCIRNYSSGVLTTFWDSLPTLDLTGRDPDIFYHVEIFKTTCGQDILMNDENVTENTTNSILNLMDIYTAVITPRNNVPGYIDGPRVVMQETFMPLKGMALYELSRTSSISISDDTPVPSYYTVILESLDGIGSNLNINVSVERDGEMIAMQIGEPLPPKCLWNALILPYNCKADMQIAELSTHDIQNVILISHPGQIRVMGDFVDGSIATGVLLIIYSPTNDSDIQYISKRPERNQNISMNVTGLTGTEYGVSVFTLEDGLPFPRVVTSPKNVHVPVVNDYDGERAQLQSTSIQFKLSSTLTSVYITCTFLDKSTTDCVAVVHERINLLSSSGLMNIVSSHKFNRSGDTAYGCIEGVNLEQYQVGVVNGKRIIPTTEPNNTNQESSLAGAIVGAVLAIAVLAFSLTAVMIFLWKNTSQEPLYSEVTTDPERLQSDATIVNIEGSSAGINNYVESALLSQEATEISATDHQRLPTPPVPPREEAAEGLGVADGAFSAPVSADCNSHENNGSTYAEPVLQGPLSTVPPPAATEKVIYDDIQGFKNKQGQLYSLPQLKSTSKSDPDDWYIVEYSEIQPQQKTRGETTSAELTSEAPSNILGIGTPPTTRDSLTVDLLFSHLSPHASKWQSLGLALSLDEDRLDEVYTNNETDEACLQEMLELYMIRSDFNHSWEEIEAALKKLDSIGVQERNWSCTSPVISGLDRFSSDMHTKTGDLKSAHITDLHASDHSWKPSHIPDTALVHFIPTTTTTPIFFSGKRWHSLGTITAEENIRIHDDDIYDFKSEPNIPCAKGSEITSDDHDDLRNSHTSSEMPGRVYLPPDPGSSLTLFVANNGHEEGLLFNQLPSQESLSDITDYNAALMNQLGIDRNSLANVGVHQQQSLEDNVHIHVHVKDSLLSQTQKLLVPGEDWKPDAQCLLQSSNCININHQGKPSTSGTLECNHQFLEHLLTQKFISNPQDPLSWFTKTPLGGQQVSKGQLTMCAVQYRQMLSQWTDGICVI